MKASAWAFVPARGGSKSIPVKSIAPLNGHPLMAYGVRAAQASGRLSRIICSTDDSAIADVAVQLGIEVDRRPDELSGDEIGIAEVVREWLNRQSVLPDLLALIQPTSPFLQPSHVRRLLICLEKDNRANSAQTVAETPHNFHPLNARAVSSGDVTFLFADKRRKAYNKQLKPPVFSFGNLVVVRPSALLDGLDFFAEPSLGMPVPRHFCLDVDGQDDLDVAAAMLQAGIVPRTHG